jgi:hypothetical protein
LPWFWLELVEALELTEKGKTVDQKADHSQSILSALLGISFTNLGIRKIEEVTR